MSQRGAQHDIIRVIIRVNSFHLNVNSCLTLLIFIYIYINISYTYISKQTKLLAACIMFIHAENRKL